MNCKQFDMARIVPNTPCDEWARGRIVQVRVPGTWLGLPAWTTDPLLVTPDGAVCEMVCDEILRPIRDPGDDAVDETLQRIGAPQQPVEA